MAPVMSFDLKDKYTDFCFGPMITPTWLKFTVFFLNSKGGIFTLNPLFLPKFEISFDYYEKMKEFYEESLKVEINYDIKKEFDFNLILLEEIKRSCVKKTHNKMKIEINNYLKNVNSSSSSSLKSIIIIDKVCEPSNEANYNQILALNFWPLTIVRTNDKGNVEFIILSEHIQPTITNNNYIEKLGFLIKSINLANYESLKVFENLELNLIYNPSQKYDLIIQYMHDLLHVDLSWIDNNLTLLQTNNLTMIQKFQSYVRFGIEFITKINYKSVIQNYKDKNKKLLNMFGYFGIIDDKNVNMKIFFLGKILF